MSVDNAVVSVPQPGLLHRFMRRLARIGADPADDSDLALKKQLLVLLSAAVVPAALIWSIIYFIAGAGWAGLVPGSYVLLAPANTALFAATRRFGFYRFTQLLIILLLPFVLMIALGGFKQSSAVIIWSALAPLTALLLDDLRRTIGWIAGFAGLLAVSAIIQPYVTPAPVSETFVVVFFALNIGTVIGIAFFELFYFVRQRNFFQERAEALLLNILPKDISEALKASPHTIAAQHDSASILFADLVGFTRLSAGLTPMEVVELLDDVFAHFDDLAEHHDVEKIKTIGDCYMVAAGVPRPRDDHAFALVAMALDMRDLVEARIFGGHRLTFRIGVNSGPVVAGVIGSKKFSYDLWGDAVNIASRMESHGEAGAIQITRATYDLVADAFDCAPRGRVAVKGGGELEVWHVVGRKATAAPKQPDEPGASAGNAGAT